MTKLKYGKKDGITGIASGKYGIKHPKESQMTESEIDMMLQRIALRRKDTLHYFQSAYVAGREMEMIG